MQWDPPSAAARLTALRLFRSIDRSLVAELPPPTPPGASAESSAGAPGPLKISVVFAEAGLRGATLGYARAMALAEQLAKGPRAAKAAAAAAAAGIAATELAGPSDARPLGAALEAAALQMLLGLVGPPDRMSHRASDPAEAGEGHGRSGGSGGAGSRRDRETHRLSHRSAAARAFRRQRARVMEATRRAVTAAHTKAKAALEPAPVDYFADL